MRIAIAVVLLLVASAPVHAGKVTGCYTQGSLTTAPAWKSDRVAFYFVVARAAPEPRFAETSQALCDGLVGKRYPVQLFYREMQPAFANVLRANKALLHKGAKFELVYMNFAHQLRMGEYATASWTERWRLPFARPEAQAPPE